MLLVNNKSFDLNPSWNTLAEVPVILFGPYVCCGEGLSSSLTFLTLSTYPTVANILVGGYFSRSQIF